MKKLTPLNKTEVIKALNTDEFDGYFSKNYYHIYNLFRNIHYSCVFCFIKSNCDWHTGSDRDDEGYVFTTYDFIEVSLCINKSTITRALNAIHKTGLIKKKRILKNNKYRNYYKIDETVYDELLKEYLLAMALLKKNKIKQTGEMLDKYTPFAVELREKMKKSNKDKDSNKIIKLTPRKALVL